jgi:hypothetical protein
VVKQSLDAVVAESGRPGGEPPYGCELEVRDLDGNRLRISNAASWANVAAVVHRLPQPKSGEFGFDGLRADS